MATDSNTSTQQTIKGYYENILFREPTASEVLWWQSQVDSGASLAGVGQDILNSSEAQTSVKPIAQLYQAILGRAPDQNGLNYWLQTYNSEQAAGTSASDAQADIANQFFQAPETQALFGSDGSTTASVTASAIGTLYKNALGRTASATEVSWWQSQAQTGNLTLQQVATQIATSTEAAAHEQDILSNAALNNYGQDIVSGTTVYSGTSGNDTFTESFAGNSTDINGLPKTFTVNGGAGNDTLALDTVPSSGIGLSPVLSSVENVLIQNSPSGMVGVNLTAAPDTTSVGITSSASSETIFTSADLVNAVSISNSKDATVTLTPQTKASSSLTASVTGSSGATINAGSASVALSATAGSSATAAKPDTVTLSDSALSTLSVNASGSEQVSGAASAKTVTVTGSSGTLAFADPLTATSVDASAYAGNLTFASTATAATTLATGSGNDNVTLSGTGVTTLTTGAGDDNVTLSSGTVQAKSVYDGGTGTNTIALSGADLSSGATFKDFSVLDLSQAAATDTYDLSKFADSSVNTVALSKTGAGGDVSFTNAQSGLAINATANDSNYNLTVTDASSVTSAADATISLTAQGQATDTAAPSAPYAGSAIGDVTFSNNTGTLTINSGAQLDASETATASDYNNTIGTIDASAGGLKTVTISGASDLSVTGINGKFDTSKTGTDAIGVDTTGATGNVNLGTVTLSGADAKSAFTFSGGSGDDSLALDGSAATAQLTGGAGQDHFDVSNFSGAATIDYTAATDALLGSSLTASTTTLGDITGATTGVESITGLSTSDTIDLSSLGLNNGVVFSGGASGVVNAVDNLKDTSTLADLKNLFVSKSVANNTVSSSIAGAAVWSDGTNELVFVNNAGTTDFDASKDSVIAVAGTGLSAQTVAQSIVMSHLS